MLYLSENIMISIVETLVLALAIGYLFGQFCIRNLVWRAIDRPTIWWGTIWCCRQFFLIGNHFICIDLERDVEFCFIFFLAKNDQYVFIFVL